MDEQLTTIQEHFKLFQESNQEDTKSIFEEMRILRFQMEDMKLNNGNSSQQLSLLKEIGKDLTTKLESIPNDVKDTLLNEFLKLENCIGSFQEFQGMKNDEMINLLNELMSNSKSSKKDLRKKYLNELIKPRSELQLGNKLLGEGGFGKVFVGRSGVKEVAVKVIRHHNLDEEKRGLENEVLFMKLCEGSRSGILEVYEIIHHPNETYISMELASRGTLSQLLSKKELIPNIPLSLMIWWIMDITRALIHIHSKKVIHFDIKPENVLLSEKCRCKLTDFGLAKQQTTAIMGLQSKASGTFLYMAPEVKLGEGGNHRSDVYSLGMTSLVILKREVPSMGVAVNQFCSSVLRMYPEYQSSLEKFFEFVLKRDRNCRISAMDAYDILQPISQNVGGDPRDNFGFHKDKSIVKTIDELAHNSFIGEDICLDSISISISNTTTVGDNMTTTSQSPSKTNQYYELFFNWFVEADIAEESAIEYAEMMVEKRIPSLKRLARKVKKDGINSFGFDEDDAEIIEEQLQMQGFLDDTKKAQEEVERKTREEAERKAEEKVIKKLEREKYEKEMREMERMNEMERGKNEAKVARERLEAERKAREEAEQNASKHHPGPYFSGGHWECCQIKSRNAPGCTSGPVRHHTHLHFGSMWRCGCKQKWHPTDSSTWIGCRDGPHPNPFGPNKS